MIQNITFHDVIGQKRQRTKKWSKRYLGLAAEIASWSKDPRRKIGAVIVGKNGEILSQGYNGFARDVNDDEKRYNDRETKHMFVVHAEMNAILNAARNGTRISGSTMYVYGLPPCCDCAKAIIQSGIRKLIIQPLNMEDVSPNWAKSFEASSTMLKEAKVKYIVVDHDANIVYDIF